MGLPAAKSAWPPAEHTGRYSRMHINDTWYGGDPVLLGGLYGGTATLPTRAAMGMGAAARAAFGWFWGKSDTSAPDAKLHVPVAQDICTMGADALFSQPARFVVQHTMFTADGTPDPAQDAQVAATQARLDLLLDNSGFDALLLAAAETGAALGSTGLKLVWNRAAGHTMPRIARIDADEIIPEYSFGELVAVTFHQVVLQKGEVVWRHLERHERGAIFHGLYMGEVGNLGRPMPLDENPITAPLAAMVDADGKIATVDGAVTAVSIPNMLPDPLDRKGSAGRSDFTPGVLTLFDAIDKAYTSLMRDIEDGQSKLIVAAYMLENRGAGKGQSFDTDQHLFTKLQMAPSEDGSDSPITQVQFKIRVDEHIKAIEHLVMRAVKDCGLNPDSSQGNDAAAITATEYNGKNARSISTRAKKLRYWQAVEPLLQGLLAVDAAYFGSGVTPLPVKLVPAPAAQDSMKTLAETANLMKQAEASSIRTRVQHLHPDWDSTQVDEEVDAIQAESSVVDVSTFGMPGAPLPPVEVEGDEVDDDLVVE